MKAKNILKKLIALSGKNAEYEFTVKNNSEFTYKKKKFDIEIIEDSDGFTFISANGHLYPFEIVSSKLNAYEVSLNGVSYSFSVETPFSLDRLKLLATLQPPTKKKNIQSPMPGQIVDVLVVKGQKVKVGEALLVLDAMKMQNTISSHFKGVVKNIVVKPGDIVRKDDILIEFEN